MDVLRCKPVLVARLTIVLLFMALLAIVPPAAVERGPSFCIFKNLFGFECLGCGLTRAFSELLHGNLARAIRFNPLVIIAFPTVTTILVHDILRLTVRRKPPRN